MRAASFVHKFNCFLVCLLFSIGTTFGQQQQDKMKDAKSVEQAKVRIISEINAIPDLVFEGVLTQAQASEALTKLKVRLADLYLAAPGKAPADPALASSDPSDPPAQEPPKEKGPSRDVVPGTAPTPPAAAATQPGAAVTHVQANKPANNDSGNKAGDGFEANFVAGVEQSGYSSRVNNTNFFLNAFFRNRIREFTKDYGFGAWGRVRLLSAPEPSTEGIVSTLTDPTGKISQTSFTKVGQVAEFVIGPEFGLHYWEGSKTRLSFIAGFGATTPLASNTAVVTYNVPDPNTVECQELVNRFGPKSGYNPYVTPDPTNTTCIYNPNSTATNKAYKYIAFSNQDRSIS